MAITRNPRSFKDSTARFLVDQTASLAANAGSTEVLARSVPTNKSCIIRAIVRVVAGVMFDPFVVVADAAADTLTKVAHGLSNGQPVFVGFDVGGSQPAGVTASLLYYARAASADTITLYDTYAHAVAGGGTGLVDITGVGASLRVFPSLIEAAYSVLGLATNRGGTMAAVGTVSVVSLEETASVAWDCTIAVDNTNKNAQIKVTPDAVLLTRVAIHAEFFESSINVQ